MIQPRIWNWIQASFPTLNTHRCNSLHSSQLQTFRHTCTHAHAYAHVSRVFQDLQTPMLQVHLTDWNPSNPSFMLSVPRQNQPPVKIQGFVAMGCSKKSRIQITTKKNHHNFSDKSIWCQMQNQKPKLQRNIGHYHNGTYTSCERFRPQNVLNNEYRIGILLTKLTVAFQYNTSQEEFHISWLWNMLRIIYFVPVHTER